MRLRIVAIALLISLTSCVEEIKFDNVRKDRIVVNCLLSSDSVQYLYLTHNAQKGDMFFNEVENAVATLSSNGLVVGTFQKFGYGKWSLDFTPEPETKYELNVSVNGFEDIYAETIFPKDVKVFPDRSKGSFSKRYFVQERADNPFWMFHLKQDIDTLMLKPAISASDRLVEFIGTSHPDADNFNASDNLMFFDTGEPGDTREHLCYIRVLSENSSHLGFYLEGAFLQSLVVFRSVSEEYDKYLKTSLMKMMSHQNFEDPTQWLDESSVYCNIKGGLGIFGAYSDHIIQCTRFDLPSAYE